MEKIVLLGAGGYCSSVLDSLSPQDYDIVGITDPNVRKAYRGIPIIGTDKVLHGIYHSGVKKCFITVGSVGKCDVRVRLANMVENIGFSCIDVIDSSAKLAKDFVHGKMIYVAKQAVINADVEMGDYCIVNSASVTEHGCRVGDHVHIAPGAVIAGDVCIGDRSHIGLNATVLQGVKIGSDVIVGAGSVVLGDIKDGQTVHGVVKGR